MTNINIMGILNITPDSFHEPNKTFSETNIKKRLNQLLKCDIIDVGAESSRPGSKRISESEELKRLNKLFNLNINFNKHTFSIDTYKPNVALQCLLKGFKIINDITGGSKEMFKLCKHFNSKIVIMHMNGEPETMQQNFNYNDVMHDIINFFNEKIEEAKSYGITSSQLILDPGIGFGKKINDNYVILNSLKELKSFELPIVIGLSRKKFLGKMSPDKKLIQTLIANTYASISGANIIRVHDIGAHLEMKKMLNQLS